MQFPTIRVPAIKGLFPLSQWQIQFRLKVGKTPAQSAVSVAAQKVMAPAQPAQTVAPTPLPPAQTTAPVPPQVMASSPASSQPVDQAPAAMPQPLAQAPVAPLKPVVFQTAAEPPPEGAKKMDKDIMNLFLEDETEKTPLQSLTSDLPEVDIYHLYEACREAKEKLAQQRQR